MLVTVVFAAWAVLVRFRSRRGHKLLTGEHNVSRLMLLGQMLCNLRMERADIADQSSKKSL